MIQHLFVRGAIVFLLVGGPSMTIQANAQVTEDQKKQEELKAAIEKAKAEAAKSQADAEKATLELEKLRLEVLKAAREAARAGQAADLQLAKERATLQKDITAAEVEAAKALIPATTIAPLEGTIGVDDKVTIEPTILAYRAADTVARTIATAITNAVPAGGAVVVHDAKTFSLAARVDILDVQLRHLHDRLAAVLKPPAPAPLAVPPTMLAPIAGGVVKSIAEIVALFRTNVDYKGRDVSVDQPSFIALVASHLGAKVQLYVPGSYLPNPVLAGQKGLLSRLGDVETLRLMLSGRVADYDAKDEKGKAADALHAGIEDARVLLQETDALMKVLAEVDDATGAATLAALLKAAQLRQVLEEAHVLEVRAVAAGGTNRTKRNLFTGGSLSHSGGVVATFTLYDRAGKVAAAGTYDAYAPLVKNGSIARTR